VGKQDRATGNTVQDIPSTHEVIPGSSAHNVRRELARLKVNRDSTTGINDVLARITETQCTDCYSIGSIRIWYGTASTDVRGVHIRGNIDPVRAKRVSRTRTVAPRH
jgi:hypothetical protein